MAMADDNLEIDIADNGKGIEDAAPSGGHGLKNLSARLQKLGGSCVVQSRADGGTTVKFRLPLTAADEVDRGPTGMQ
jgi:signal transduction histidine kinase